MNSEGYTSLSHTNVSTSFRYLCKCVSIPYDHIPIPAKLVGTYPYITCTSQICSMFQNKHWYGGALLKLFHVAKPLFIPQPWIRRREMALDQWEIEEIAKTTVISRAPMKAFSSVHEVGPEKCCCVITGSRHCLWLSVNKSPTHRSPA